MIMIGNEDIVKPFEFSLKVNDNIICKRYFNVRNYNENFRESLEVKHMLKDIMGIDDSYNLGIIPDFFKGKCVNKTWESYNPSYYQKKIRAKDIYEIEDNFYFEVLIDGEVVASTCFSGNLFQYNVRRKIDIKPIIPKIVRSIEYWMSQNEYTSEYADISINRENKLTGKALSDYENHMVSVDDDLNYKDFYNER